MNRSKSWFVVPVLLAAAALFSRPALARLVGTAPTNPDAWCVHGGSGGGGSAVSGAEACVDYSGNFLPTVTNAQTLGTSSLKFSNVYATTLTGNLVGGVTTTASSVAASSSTTSAFSIALVGAYTTAQLQVSTPTALGQLIYNSTLSNVCVSTGTTAVEQWKLVGTSATTCQ